MSSPGSLSRHVDRFRPGPSLAETAALVERLTMEADLRQALVAGDLVLRYQPIVDLEGGHVIAFETLCRWRHWSRGLLGPAQFLPLAEETGLIVPIGAWVLEEASRRLAAWWGRLPGVDAVGVTINLSAAELHDRGLVDRAAFALDAAGLPPERFVVEVNEGAAYAEPQDRAARNLRALTELGVGLAVDDVGLPRPGHRSGLPDPDGWLWALPVRMLKIDRSVAVGLGQGPDQVGSRAARTLTAAVGLAAERGIPAVAKGIETAAQLAELYRRGCPAGQGFLFARPMDPSDAEAYLRRVTGRGAST
jgi:EAL domain-containing protein (putative c-di-GMP-specific phosphodiesterase class I)